MCEKLLKVMPPCFPCWKQSAKSHAPLRMILTPKIGHRAQIDLIDITTKAIHDYNCILQYVDHLSRFAHVACYHSKSSEAQKLYSLTMAPNFWAIVSKF
jgi:hypothetical protein